jgi:DNA-binding FadR family transcriptional regulator
VLGGEIEASAALGVSRTAYREAIRILSAKGLVESRPKAGTRVLPRRHWNMLDPDVLAWTFEGEPDTEFILDLFELRAIIEPRRRTLAAQRRGAEDVEAMRTALADMARYTLAAAEGRAADQLFHRAILKAARNEPLAALASTVGAAVHWTTVFKQRERELPRDPLPITYACARRSPPAMPADAREAMSELLRLALADLGTGAARALSPSDCRAVCRASGRSAGKPRRPRGSCRRQAARPPTLDFLPRRSATPGKDSRRTLRRSARRAASSSSLSSTSSRLCLRIDPHPVTGAEQREIAPGRRLGRGIEDRGASAGARLAPVADARQLVHAIDDQVRRRAHVHHLGRARIADRAGSTHDQHARGRDPGRRIVDPFVIVLGTVEYHDRPFERVGVVRVRQVAVAEGLRDHAGLHDRVVEQVAREHEEAGVRDQRVVEPADHPLVLDLGAAAVVADRLAVRGDRALDDQACAMSCATTAGTPPA